MLEHEYTRSYKQYTERFGANDSGNCIKIIYESRNQFKECLEHELDLRPRREVMDLFIIVLEARRAIMEIRFVMDQLNLKGSGYLCLDGSYKFIRKSEFHTTIASHMHTMLLGKFVWDDLVTSQKNMLVGHHTLVLPESNQEEFPESLKYLSYDGGLNSEISTFICSIIGDDAGDMQYPSLVIDVGDSQSRSELLFKSLLHSRVKAMPTDTIITADYPLRKFGKLTLNKNPENYFADVEQAALLRACFTSTRQF